MEHTVCLLQKHFKKLTKTKKQANTETLKPLIV